MPSRRSVFRRSVRGLELSDRVLRWDLQSVDASRMAVTMLELFC
jgi:hypothetical protein